MAECRKSFQAFLQKTVLSCILLLQLLGSNFTSCQNLSLTVESTTGTIRGKVQRVLNTEVKTFLGIPYALPPVGNLRFRNPIPVKPWRGVYEAVKKSANCIQYTAIPEPSTAPPPYSEDCLYLNVWVPQTKNEKRNHPPRAVLVFIHGGGAYSGSSNMEIYDGSVLASLGDIIVASMNYRLGVFGFLYANVEDAPGNMGIMDQILAMQWIKDNAKVFGGDPDRITISGQSFGSVSVSLHILSPLSRGLFHRGIMIGAKAYHPVFRGDTQTRAVARGDKFAWRVGCSNENISLITHPQMVLRCLKLMDPMLLAQEESFFWIRDLIWFYPTYPSKFLPMDPLLELREGKFNIKEILTGHNSNEGSLFITLLFPQYFISKNTVNVSEATAAFQIYAPLAGFPSLDEVRDEYVKDKNNPQAIIQSLIMSFSDYGFKCPTVIFSEYFSRKNSLYYYVFDHRPSTSPWRPWMGSTHFSDLYFVFGDPLRNRPLYTAEEVYLSKIMIGAWASFTKRGKPVLPYGELWTPVSKKHQQYLWIESDRQVMREISKKHCRFWDRNFS